MKPWVGCNYKTTRLLIVGESHQLPDGVTKLNYDEDTWYDSRQKDVDNPVIDARGVSAHDWMDTSFTVTDRSHSKKETYLKIERATEMSFDEFAFFNYIFRPVEQWAGGYCNRKRRRKFNIGDRDRAVSREIMEWFILSCAPRLIVVASKCVIRYGGVVSCLDGFPDICTTYTDHPTASGGFRKDVRRVLGLS